MFDSVWARVELVIYCEDIQHGHQQQLRQSMSCFRNVPRQPWICQELSPGWINEGKASSDVRSIRLIESNI